MSLIHNIKKYLIKLSSFLCLFKSSSPKKQESVSAEGENADENAETKAVEEETEETGKENKGE